MISNSFKYHKLSRKQPYVKITVKTMAEDYVIEVEDNGDGIPKDQLGKVFDMFYRASEKSQGSGLGLYIVKNTVMKLGGKIEIDSNYEGTTLRATLPNKLSYSTLKIA